MQVQVNQTRISAIFLALALAAIVPAEDLFDGQPRAVAVKLFRPGVNGVAAIPPKGGALVSLGYSWEEPATGSTLTGLSGFYEYSITSKLAVYVTSAHLLST